MAAGGALWGLVASHLSITFALLCASAALLLGLFASLRCRLPVTQAGTEVCAATCRLESTAIHAAPLSSITGTSK
ncbi:MFS transporter [Pseudomonas sp. 2VD]|uniref:MFS transporter n=1 Tax=Pseudomonas sp. 2VD TaxID=2502205 RepID=UPI003FA7D416